MNRPNPSDVNPYDSKAYTRVPEWKRKKIRMKIGVFASIHHIVPILTFFLPPLSGST